MHRLRLRWVIPFVLAAIGMFVVAPPADAAINLQNGCKNTLSTGPNPGAEMGHYPAYPGSQSYLRIACIFSHVSTPNPPGDFVSATYTIHDFSNVVYHSGSSRTVTSNSAIPVGGTTFTTADCAGLNAAPAAWVNRKINTVGGVAGLPARITVLSAAACNPAGTVTLNRAATAIVPSGTVFQIENSAVRDVSDATVQNVTPMICSATANFNAFDTTNLLSITGTLFTNGTAITGAAAGCPVGSTGVDVNPVPNTAAAQVNQVVTIGGTLDGSFAAATNVTSTRTVNDGSSAAANSLQSTAARFFVTDVGLKVSGTGITQPCYIQTRTSATSVVLTSACSTISAGPNTITIGEPSRTAPLPTDTVLNQAVQLPLNPALVAGSAPCSSIATPLTEQPAGFGIEGTWLNPGSFIGGAFATQPAGTKAIGEILFQTSVVSFGAYILEIPAGLGIDPLIGGFHYNVVFPNVPTGLALCPSTPQSPGISFSIGVNGTVASVAQIPTGVGRPGTAQLRSTRASTTGATSTIFITDDVNGAGVKWTGAPFNRLCGPLAAGPADINFTCGDG